MRGKFYKVEKIKHILTTTENVIIPTKHLIREKVDLRVIGCINAISNTDNCMQRKDYKRFCTIKKINNNLKNFEELLNINRVGILERIKKATSLESDEFYFNKDDARIEINYSDGGYIVLGDLEFEYLVKNLSNNAFKLYLNLLWICRDEEGNLVERQLTQPFLLESIGLSKNSKRLMLEAEKELVSLDLIKVRVEREVEFSEDLTITKPKTKKFYKVLDKK